MCVAKALPWLRHGSPILKLRHVARQGVDVRGLQALLLQHMAEQHVLRKPAHAHRGLGPSRGLIGRQYTQHAVLLLHCHQPKVQVGGRAAVDAQLFQAGSTAQCGGAEVQKIELQRFLELVDKIARQQQPGDMGFDALHGLCGMAKRLRLALQLAHQGFGRIKTARQHGRLARRRIRTPSSSPGRGRPPPPAPDGSGERVSWRGTAWEAAAGAGKDNSMVFECARCLTSVNRPDQEAERGSRLSGQHCICYQK